MEEGVDPRAEVAAMVLSRLVPGADAGEPDEVVRRGAALLVRRGRLLTRVRPVAMFDTALREVQIARVFRDLRVPHTPLVESAEQPWTVDDWVVTAWRWIETGQGVTTADLGLLARTLRERTAVAAAAVPAFEPLTATAAMVAHLPFDDADARFVRGRIAELVHPWHEVRTSDPLGRSIVHGDLHRANVVAGRTGPLLTDLELSGSGPSSFDAAPTVLAHRRYQLPASRLKAFLGGFGADPRGWEGFETCVQVYELWAAAWAVGNRHKHPTWDREAAVRVAGLRDGDDRPWTLL